MEPSTFPEANCKHGAPTGLNEAHVKTMPSFKATIEGGVFDGSEMVIVAWKPTPADMERLAAGGLVYLSMMGGLAPHFLSSSFEEAKML